MKGISLQKKLMILVLFPIIGSYFILFLFFVFLNKTKNNGTLINIAGRQRMLALEILDRAERITLGKDHDFDGLQKRMHEFENTLNVFRQGGKIDSTILSPLPNAFSPVLNKLDKQWELVKHDLNKIFLNARLNQSMSFSEAQLQNKLYKLRNLSDDLVHKLEFYSLSLGKKYLLFLFLGGILNTIIAFIFFYSFRRTTFSSIKLLTDYAHTISKGEFNKEIRVPSRDELALLANAFNTMREQISQLFSHLQERTDQLEQLIQNMPIGLAVFDNANRIVHYNRAIADIFKIPEHEKLSKLEQLPIYEDLQRNLVEKANVSAFSLNTFLTTIENEKSDRKFLRISITPIPIQDSHTFLLTIQDLTAEHELKAHIQKVEREFSEIVEHMRDGVVVMDKNGIIQYVNRAIENMFGYSRTELIGTYFSFLLQSQHDETFLKKLNSASSRFSERIDGESLTLEGLKKSGERFPLEMTLSMYELNSHKTYIALIRDITSRIEALRALQQSEQNFRTLIERNPDAVAVHRNGVFIYVNPSMVRLLGYNSADELIGKPVLSIVHPDDREVVIQRIQHMVAHGKMASPREERFIRKDGSLVYAEVIALPVEFEGEPAIVAIGRDLTERKAHEQRDRRRLQILTALAEGHELISTIRMILKTIEEETEGIRCELLIDNRLRGRIITIESSSHTPILDQMRSAFLSDFLDELDIHHFREQSGDRCTRTFHKLSRFFEKKGLNLVTYFPIGLNQKDYQAFLFVFSGLKKTLTHGEEQNISSLLHFVQIALERTFAKEKLREREWHLNRAQFVSKTGSWVYDLGKSSFTCSDQLYRILEVSPERSLSFEDYRAFVHPEDKEKVRNYWERVLTGSTFEIIYRIVVGKKIKWVQETVEFENNEDSRPVRILGILQDITHHITQEEERKKLKEQLHQAQKMEAIGRLAGGIAHDFNNMLTVILGHAEIAQLHCTPDEPIYKNLEEIIKAAESSAGIIQRLLAFARRQPLQMIEVNLNEVIPDTINMLQRLIGENIQLRWNPGHDAGLVKIDLQQLDQLLANLVINARDAIETTGTITISTYQEKVSKIPPSSFGEVRPGVYVVLEVSDTGHGMDEDTIQRIFEPFFTTKSAEKGTGLGLSIVYGLVQQHNGFIQVLSEIGKGTTFKIFFPISMGTLSSKNDEKKIPQMNMGAGTILLVEDEKEILQVLASRLREQGYTVLGFNHPVVSLEFVRENKPVIDVLLTDFIMPELNGIELYRKLQRFYPSLKCILMSGHIDKKLDERELEALNIHFLQKPVRAHQIAQIIQEMLKEGNKAT